MLNKALVVAATLGQAIAPGRNFRADADQILSRAKNAGRICVNALANATGNVLIATPAKREFENLMTIFEIRNHGQADKNLAHWSRMLNSAAKELSVVEGRDLELISYVGDRRLYVEGAPLPVRYAPGTVLAVDRQTHLVVGVASPELIQRVIGWARIRTEEPVFGAFARRGYPAPK